MNIVEEIAKAVGETPRFPLHWPPHRNRGTEPTPKRRLSRSCIPQRIGRRLTTAQFFWRCWVQGQCS